MVACNAASQLLGWAYAITQSFVCQLSDNIRHSERKRPARFSPVASFSFFSLPLSRPTCQEFIPQKQCFHSILHRPGPSPLGYGLITCLALSTKKIRPPLARVSGLLGRACDVGCSARCSLYNSPAGPLTNTTPRGFIALFGGSPRITPSWPTALAWEFATTGKKGPKKALLPHSSSSSTAARNFRIKTLI